MTGHLESCEEFTYPIIVDQSYGLMYTARFWIKNWSRPILHFSMLITGGWLGTGDLGIDGGSVPGWIGALTEVAAFLARPLGQSRSAGDRQRHGEGHSKNGH